MKSLNYSEEAEKIILVMNASLQEWKAVLQQLNEKTKKRHSTRYENEMWSKQETRYDAKKRECKDLLKALKKVRFWLYEIKFIIEIDANILMTQLNRSTLNLSDALMTRWLAWIRLFDFEVRHVSEKKHDALNELSRRSREFFNDQDEAHEKNINDFIDAQLNVLRLCSIIVTLKEKKLVLENSYSNHSRVIAKYLITLSRFFDMITKEFRKFKLETLKFLIRDKHLFRRIIKTKSLQRVIDRQKNRDRILQKLHDESEHKDKEETYRKIIERYWWKSVWKNVCAYVKFCEKCQLRTSRREKKTLHLTWTAAIWEKIEVNVIHMLLSDEKRYIVLAWNDLSEWVKRRALKSADAKFVARFLYENVICRHDCMKKLMMNEEFENKDVIEVLIERYKIWRVVVLIYHSQTNDMMKRRHMTIVNALAKMTMTGNSHWTRHFHSVLWANRTTVRAFTEMTLYRVLYESDAVLSVELDISTWQILFWEQARTTSKLLTLRARQLKRRNENLKEAALHLRRMRETDKEIWDDQRRIHTSLIVKNDLVLLHDTKLNNIHIQKLTWRWLESFRVVKVNSIKNWYKIAEVDEAILKKTVAENWLKKFVTRSFKSDVSEKIQQENDDL